MEKANIENEKKRRAKAAAAKAETDDAAKVVEK